MLELRIITLTRVYQQMAPRCLSWPVDTSSYIQYPSCHVTQVE